MSHRDAEDSKQIRTGFDNVSETRYDDITRAINFNTRLLKDGIKRYIVSEEPVLDSPRSLRLRGKP
jgi:hypothetical protein